VIAGLDGTFALLEPNPLVGGNTSRRNLSSKVVTHLTHTFFYFLFRATGTAGLDGTCIRLQRNPRLTEGIQIRNRYLG